MNEKDLKEFREEQDRKETEKMMKAINRNYRKAYDKRLLEEQVKKIENERQSRRRTRLDIATVIVMILMAITIIVMLVFGANNYNDYANSCDDAKGYICSDYEVKQYAVKGE